MKVKRKETDLRKDIPIKGMHTIWKKIRNGMLSVNKEDKNENKERRQCDDGKVVR